MGYSAFSSAPGPAAAWPPKREALAPPRGPPRCELGGRCPTGAAGTALHIASNGEGSSFELSICFPARTGRVKGSQASAGGHQESLEAAATLHKKVRVVTNVVVAAAAAKQELYWLQMHTAVV